MGSPRTKLALALGFALSAAALWLVASSTDFSAATDTIARADPRLLIPIGPVLAVELILRSARWRALLPERQPRGDPVPIRRILPVLVIGYLGNAILPARLGEGIRAYLLARREHLDVAATLGSVALERIVDTATIAGVALAAAVVVGAPEWLIRASGVVAIVAGALIAALCTTGLERPLAGTERTLLRLGPPKLAVRLLSAVLRFARGLDGAGRRRSVLFAGAISTTAWLLDGMIYWLIGMALGIGVSPAAALLIAAITTLGTAIPSAPGYVGTFELAGVAVAAAIGVPPDDGLALAVLAHAATVLPVAAAGAVSLSYVGGGGLGGLAEKAASARKAAS